MVSSVLSRRMYAHERIVGVFYHNKLLKQEKNSAHCSFIGMNDAYFNSQCLYNAKRLLSEILSSKKHGKVSFDKKVYHD